MVSAEDKVKAEAVAKAAEDTAAKGKGEGFASSAADAGALVTKAAIVAPTTLPPGTMPPAASAPIPLADFVKKCCKQVQVFMTGQDFTE